LGDDKYLIVLNFSKNEVTWRLPEDLGVAKDWLLLTSNYNLEDIYEWETSADFLLRPYEGKIWRKPDPDDEGYFGSEQSASGSSSE